MRVILPFRPISFSFPHEEPIEPSAIIQAAVATGLHPSFLLRKAPLLLFANVGDSQIQQSKLTCLI